MRERTGSRPCRLVTLHITVGVGHRLFTDRPSEDVTIQGAFGHLCHSRDELQGKLVEIGLCHSRDGGPSAAGHGLQKVGTRTVP